MTFFKVASGFRTITYVPKAHLLRYRHQRLLQQLILKRKSGENMKINRKSHRDDGFLLYYVGTNSFVT